MTRALPRRLLILTHVTHVREGGQILAYAPYAREATEWCKLFESVTIAAPISARRNGGDWEAIRATNVTLQHIRVPSGGGLWGRAQRLAYAPIATLKVSVAMLRADAVQVRGPGYLGLLGTMLAPLLAPRRVAKYAGQWGDFPGEAPASRFQRWLLRSRWWGAPVLAYTIGLNEPRHVVPFFSASLSERDLSLATTAMQSRAGRGTTRVLYVGRLTRAKNVHVLLEALARVRQLGVPLHCTVVGEGGERRNLEELTRALRMEEHVRFDGGLPMHKVLTRYQEADALVLPSETEGWPKVLLEGMAFGLLCIGPDRGIVPYLVGKGGGWVVRPGDVEQLTTVLTECVKLPAEESLCRRTLAHEWGRLFTIEEFSRNVLAVLPRAWGVSGTGLQSVATNA